MVGDTGNDIGEFCLGHTYSMADVRNDLVYVAAEQTTGGFSTGRKLYKDDRFMYVINVNGHYGTVAERFIHNPK